MAEHAIPVDLYNPGQVFACLGFLEAADMLLGDAEGGFDWSDAAHVLFGLRAAGGENPVAAVLEYLASVTPRPWAPIDYAGPASSKNAEDDEDESESDAVTGEEKGAQLELSETFLGKEGDRMALPIRLGGGNLRVIELSHWADGSSRNNFKLYAGNRSAEKIARAMLLGVREKPKKNQAAGELRTKGIRQLWEEQADALIARPFDVLTPMGGSFNFDPRGAWTAINAGYSPNDQGDQIASSPVVEFLAALGLEHARPDEYETRKVRYAAWGIPLPPMLARAALCSALTTVPLQRFRFELDMPGKNKAVTFAEMEIRP